MAAAALALAAPVRAGEPGPPPPVPTLRVGVPRAPGAVAGFDRDLFLQAAREAGADAIFDEMPPSEALAALDAGRLDVAAGPFPPAAAARRRALPTVALDGDALLKRRGDGSLRIPENAAGKRVGTLGPPAGAARLRAEATALHARVAPRPSAFADPLGDLAAGRLAALVGDLPEVAAAALARPGSFEVLGPLLGRTVRLAPLLRADRPDLAARLDAALVRITADGRLAEMQRRWFGIAFEAAGPRVTPGGPPLVPGPLRP